MQLAGNHGRALVSVLIYRCSELLILFGIVLNGTTTFLTTRYLIKVQNPSLAQLPALHFGPFLASLGERVEKSPEYDSY